MNVMRKIATAFRGSVRESAEVVIDANAIRIFEQEILDAEQGLARSKQQLAYVMAERVQLERVTAKLHEQVTVREAQTAKALETNNEALANELAEDILEKEALINEHKESSQELSVRERKLTQSLKGAAQQIKMFRRELSITKATESAHKASKIASHHTWGVVTNISDLHISLQRIKQKQQSIDDTSDAAITIENKIGENSLDIKVENAGLGSNTSDIQAVLARVKK
jgi:phage shock protein A